jgi:hypothetical protein
MPWKQTASFAYASSDAEATNESYAPDLTGEHTAQDAPRARNLEGSYQSEADVLKPEYVGQTSLTPRDYAFAGSLKRSTPSDPARPRHRKLIAVLSFIGVVCMALSAYLYFFAINKAERPPATQNAARTRVDSGVQNSSAAPSGNSERSTVQGKINAVVPLAEPSGADVANRINNNAGDPGKTSSTMNPECSEVVDALGLCPPQAAQRR